MKKASERWVGVLIGMVLTMSMARAGTYSGGSGTADDPYQIATAQDLIELGNNLNDYNKHFIQTENIDLDPNLPDGRVFDRAVIAWNNNDDFSDYFVFDGVAFTGTFNGQGFAIRRLTIRGRAHLSSFHGLFGKLSQPGVVENIRLLDINIDSDNSDSYIGGLVGLSDGGEIDSCYCMGKIRGRTDVGLIAGRSSGTIAQSHCLGIVNGRVSVGALVGTNTGTVVDCLSDGTVTGDPTFGAAVGGLAGANVGRLNCCLSRCAVTGGYDVGGLVGKNSGDTCEISNCSSLGSVEGSHYVGGLVGSNEGVIDQTYSVSQVGSSSMTSVYMGGLVGLDLKGVVNDSFWGLQTSRQNSSAGGIGLDTSEMQDPNTYLESGWDFVGENANGSEGLWEMQLDRYPMLVLKFNSYSGGAGTPDDPYQISNVRDLCALGETWTDYDKHFILINDVNLDPNLPTGQVFTRAIIAPSMNPKVDTFDGDIFTGVLDGNDFRIHNLTILGKNHYIGLFGALGSNAVVINLSLESVSIDAKGSTFVGGLVGKNLGARVTNCSVTGTVGGLSFVGGLVGENNSGVFDNCQAVCSVTGNYVGGLVGGNGGQVRNCSSQSYVSGGSIAGGLVGSSSGEVQGCTSSGIVNGYTIGGLIGKMVVSAQVTDCTSSGNIDGNVFVGGLVGEFDSGVIRDSNSTVSVHGNKEVGGLVGTCMGEISACVSYGAVEGGPFVGGLVGSLQDGGKVFYCASSSPVFGTFVTGGLVGLVHEGSVANSYCQNDITGNESVGGLVGRNDNGSLRDCYSVGSVAGKYSVGGLIETGSPYKGDVVHCYWDTEVSGKSKSGGGEGLTTAQMQDINTYLNAGWDFVGETENGTDDIWTMPEHGYPQLVP